MRLIDQYLIAVDNVWDEGDGSGFKYLHAAHYFDKERDRYERKMRKGVIYRAPLGFSEERHMPIDPGLPNHKRFIGHDDIQRKVNEGYMDWDNSKYHPGATDQFRWITRADYGRLMTAKDGDEVYFHPSITEAENFFHVIDGKEIYRAHVHEIILSAGVPQGGWVILEPIADQTEIGGLLTSLDEVDKQLVGKVYLCRDGAGVTQGEIVHFQKDANWDFWIGDKRYFAMKEEDLLMVL